MKEYRVAVSAPQAVKIGIKPQDWRIDFCYAFPETVDEARQILDDEQILHIINSQIRSMVQVQVRRLAQSGVEDRMISTLVKEWKVGDTIKIEKSQVVKALDSLAKLSPEEREKVLSELTQ